MYYQYSIIYSEYDEYYEVKLQHPKKYAQLRFGKIITEAFQKIVDSEAETDEYYQQCHQSQNFTNYIRELISVLVKDYGFREVTDNTCVTIKLGHHGEDDKWIRGNVKRPKTKCKICEGEETNDPELNKWYIDTYCTQKDTTKWGKDGYGLY